MTPGPGVQIRRHTAADLPAIERTLVDLHAEIYPELLHLPLFTIEAFTERLHGQAALPGWEAVLANLGDRCIGYAYGAHLPATARLFDRLEPPLSTEHRDWFSRGAFFIYEYMLIPESRGQGAGGTIYRELLDHRPERHVLLCVRQDNDLAQSIYRHWGYHVLGVNRPTPDGPSLDVLHLERVHTPGE